jgi:ArsR family transcriptional regulator
MSSIMPDSQGVLKAVADSTRQRLLRVLSLHDLSVSELVEVLGQPQSTISRHLKVLRDAGLLVDRRAGTTVTYAARPPQTVQGDEAGVGTTVGKNGLSAGGGLPGLRDRLLDWVGQEKVDEEISRRLDLVVASREVERSDFFDAVGSRWDQLRVEAFGETFPFEALTALLPADWKVADIGTGTGYLLPLLSQRFERVIAIDPAVSMLDVARSRPELKSASNVEFREGSLADLPLADGEVDLLIASLVLHHVDEPAAAIAELRRCLSVGGRLMILEQEEHHHAAFHERMGDRWWGFAPDDLRARVEKAGFDEVRTIPMTTARRGKECTMDVPPLFVLTARVVSAAESG